MSNYARIQGHIDKGKGRAAHHVGMPFLAYRLISTSAGDFPSGWSPVATPAGTAFSLLRRRLSEGKLELGIKSVALFYDIVANMNPFLVGDVFVQNDAAFVPNISYGAGATQVPGTTIEFNGMCLAWHPPENKAVGARIDRRVKIYRPATSPATTTTPAGGSTQYWKETLDNDRSLMLINGTYSFGVPGANNANFIPCGFTAAIRQHDWVFQPGIPGMLKEAKWFAYLPPLPGYFPKEGDALVDEYGSRYLIAVPYEQKTGVAGYQLAIDRKIAGDDVSSGQTASTDFADPSNTQFVPGLT